MTTSQERTTPISRRQVLTGAAVVGVAAGAGAALAACGADSGTGSNGAANSGPVTVPVAQVPVGGAAIVGQVVVSQPTAGDFKAFSAVCTHEQCLVSRVQAGNVVCSCHMSTFSTADGS